MTVNDEVAELGCRVDVDADVVCVDGVPVGIKPDLVYFLLNKPEGVVTTASDPQGRPTVLSLVPECPGLTRLAGSTWQRKGSFFSLMTETSLTP